MLCMNAIPMSCEKCGDTFKNVSLLETHKTTHENECSFCQKTFLTNKAMLQHRAHVHSTLIDFTQNIIPLKVHINVFSTRQPDTISWLSSMRTNYMPWNKCAHMWFMFKFMIMHVLHLLSPSGGKYRPYVIICLVESLLSKIAAA